MTIGMNRAVDLIAQKIARDEAKASKQSEKGEAKKAPAKKKKKAAPKKKKKKA